MEINNVDVNGIAQAVNASGYPMNTKINNWLEEDDWERADELANNPPGVGHNGFLKLITITADIKATIKWWAQWSRYSFSEMGSSQSSIHKLKDMDLDNAYIEYVDDRIIKTMKELQQKYNDNPIKENFYRMIYSNPVGMELTARITTNYLQEKTVYKQRKNHELVCEWGKYCDWLESLPHSQWITKNE